MMPCHRDALGRIVFQIDSSRGKGYKHILPSESFLDRRKVVVDAPELYFKEEIDARTNASTHSREARFSIDCTTEQLQELLEMILSFHACYKYGSRNEKGNFDRNVRKMMGMIKERINRGHESKNWSISKFHELLHMPVDTINFGHHANIDAGKGEHGLKKWAKVPSKTVRTRSADHYYQDMATRIYENRLIELATSTVVPRSALTLDIPGGSDVGDGSLAIVLSNLLMKLDVIVPSLLPSNLTEYLRSKPNLLFPMEIYQEAKVFRNQRHNATIRATPNYRSSGPWHDCVLVTYENNKGEKTEYPFQVHAFFCGTGPQTYSAVGKMGMHSKQSSRLMTEWTYEKQYRVVDLETTSRIAFALTIPMSCYGENGGNVPHRMFVMKDRIDDWPSIFNKCNASAMLFPLSNIFLI